MGDGLSPLPPDSSETRLPVTTRIRDRPSTARLEHERDVHARSHDSVELGVSRVEPRADAICLTIAEREREASVAVSGDLDRIAEGAKPFAGAEGAHCNARNWSTVCQGKSASDRDRMRLASRDRRHLGVFGML